MKIQTKTLLASVTFAAKFKIRFQFMDVPQIGMKSDGQNTVKQASEL